MRLVVAITGATGSVIGVRILRALRELDVETHLVLSRWGKVTLELETGLDAAAVRAMATHSYGPGEQCAAIASGSFRTDGMIIAPCSMKTLGAIRAGYGEGLVARAADVTIKERRRLVVVPRELPLSEIHLENMLAMARLGVVIAPPMPAFYNHPKTIDDLVTHLCARVLDQFGLDLPAASRWRGLPSQVPDRPGRIERLDSEVQS
jgi:4-hydroxy-3-polyprenylbenzoate decarboxylase